MAFSLRDTLEPCSRRVKVDRTIPCFSANWLYEIGLPASAAPLSVTASSSDIVALRYCVCKMGWLRGQSARYGACALPYGTYDRTDSKDCETPALSARPHMVTTIRERARERALYAVSNLGTDSQGRTLTLPCRKTLGKSGPSPPSVLKGLIFSATVYTIVDR
jgi:hypothetical protein